MIRSIAVRRQHRELRQLVGGRLSHLVVEHFEEERQPADTALDGHEFHVGEALGRAGVDHVADDAGVAREQVGRSCRELPACLVSGQGARAVTGTTAMPSGRS